MSTNFQNQKGIKQEKPIQKGKGKVFKHPDPKPQERQQTHYIYLKDKKFKSDCHVVVPVKNSLVGAQLTAEGASLVPDVPYHECRLASVKHLVNLILAPYGVTYNDIPEMAECYKVFKDLEARERQSAGAN